MNVSVFVWFFALILLTSNDVTPKNLPIVCPDDSQTRLRGLSYCPDASEHYSCLNNTESLSDKEHCSKELDFTTPGQKYVWTNQLRNVPCSDSRYQPFKFDQNQGKRCKYQKSLCNEEGQMIYENRSLLEDRTCRCDHTQSYSHVTKPNNEYYCIPSEEDCSCYKKRCNKNEVLGSDYECVSADDKATKSRCSVPLNTSVKPKIDEKKIKHKDDRTDLVDTDARVVAKYGVLAATCILILILATLTLLFVNTVLFDNNSTLSHDNPEENNTTIDSHQTKVFPFSIGDVGSIENGRMLSIMADQSVEENNSTLKANSSERTESEAKCTKDDSQRPTMSPMEGDTDRPNDLKPTRCKAVFVDVHNHLTNQSENIDSDSPHVLLEKLRSRRTNVSVWRGILKDELVQYNISSDECDGKRYLRFLVAIFKSAIGAANIGSETVNIPTDQAPRRLNQNNLHKLLRAMNLMIDERDANSELRYLCVYLSDSNINIDALKQFHELVQALGECDWQILETVLFQPESISDGYQERLFQTLLLCTEKDGLEIEGCRQEEIADLYSSEIFSMSRLGFYRDKPSEPFFWTAPENQAHETLITILSGLYAPKIHKS